MLYILSILKRTEVAFYRLYYDAFSFSFGVVRQWRMFQDVADTVWTIRRLDCICRLALSAKHDITWLAARRCCVCVKIKVLHPWLQQHMFLKKGIWISSHSSGVCGGTWQVLCSWAGVYFKWVGLHVGWVCKWVKHDPSLPLKMALRPHAPTAH